MIPQDTPTSECRIDPALVLAWLTARSIGRGLPLPVRDRGGFRVDTHSEKETRRWVFPGLDAGIGEIAREVSAPRHFLKLCGTEAELRGVLPDRWAIEAASWMMTAATTSASSRPLPDDYALKTDRAGPTTEVRILAPDGSVAASGFAVEAAGVFIYDRIQTSPRHRRKGLGTAVMAALAAARRSSAAPEILVATEAGRALYARLGWSVHSPYSTAAIPEAP